MKVDCSTCEFAKRDEYGRFIDICSGSGNCDYQVYSGITSKTISEMTEDEYDIISTKVFNNMRKKYPMMTSGDIQSVEMFISLYKDECLK